MNQNDLLLHVLDTSYSKENWFAPLKHTIEGITAEQASWRPAEGTAHTIWENVNHLIYYKERIVAKMKGNEGPRSLDGDETFFITEQSNDDEWKKVVDRAEDAYRSIRQTLVDTSDEKLSDRSLETDLLDIMLYDAYHTGQIIQIRKMQESWPSHR
ncbi:DinB family protein [Halobacillus mangrovi]|uniref:DinB family protein n=1 Tax=Halobacillus mangrovi TaxID=402384 RepID=UPI003D958CEC